MCDIFQLIEPKSTKQKPSCAPYYKILNINICLHNNSVAVADLVDNQSSLEEEPENFAYYASVGYPNNFLQDYSGFR